MNLIGYVNGAEIRFDFRPPSTFTATLPATKSGACVVELHAVDDAGNVDGYTAEAVLIDFDQLRFRAIEPCYSAGELETDFADRPIAEYYFAELPGTFGTRELDQQYGFREAV